MAESRGRQSKFRRRRRKLVRWLRDYRWPMAGLAALVVVLLVLGGVALSRRQQPADPGTVPIAGSTPATATQPLLAVIGDSYSAGSNEGGVAGAGWPALLASRMGWRLANTAVGGTGYVNSRPPMTAPFPSRVEPVIAARPRLVIVEGSRNDLGHPLAAVVAAARDLYHRIRTGAPSATLVVIGPIWDSGNPPRTLLVMRDALHRVASAAGARWIDPLAEGWFAGRYAALIGADRVHPTNQGHVYLESVVARDLRRLGLATQDR